MGGTGVIVSSSGVLVYTWKELVLVVKMWKTGVNVGIASVDVEAVVHVLV